jgi:hypothetical protein
MVPPSFQYDAALAGRSRSNPYAGLALANLPGDRTELDQWNGWIAREV